ncbi:YisK (plasmid) [Peptoclostridium acidaminophilum DSM 3953]|uniref:YisK n=1 Tax=Peptoclostridium acidaminophilum DSM 3953 TaxID=1286171 RepID=W8T8D2_PEPAC|nr:fumarylacetoacetate hydrolase family protein [Peptoclostridium acidaminophilum]AHM57969.1 YisK [Peptoclostridium acidaminophilum DSM 3953]
MKFVTFESEGKQNIGILSKEGVVKMSDIFKALGKDEYPKDMNGFIGMCNESLLADIIHADSLELTQISMDDVRICAPIPYPRRNVICIGKNYSDHVKEMEGSPTAIGSERPESPIYFTKSAWPAIGDGDAICSHEDLTSQLDYEVELAVIIGKGGRDIPSEKAFEHIFGYTIVNDVSARDLQSSRKQWFKGKSLDTFTPMGPCILHRDSVPFPPDLSIESHVNGERRQSSRTANMIFGIPEIISDISKGFTLIEGDIICTGTPSGVGAGFKPQRFLKKGDIVRIDIEGIGTLTNHVK